MKLFVNIQSIFSLQFCIFLKILDFSHFVVDFDTAMAQLKDLHEFLIGAELQHYYNNFVRDLKVTTVPQIKYVDDNDLLDVGMSKPEIRRLRRLFSKEHPKGALGKLKKAR